MTAPQADLHGLGGHGPDVLFIHGFGSDRYSWAANAPAMADWATVWAVDLPGHGQAPDEVGAGDAKTLGAAVAERLSDIPGAIVVVGHSLGGAVAIELAKLLPDRVKRLVLIAPAGLGQRLDHEFLTAFPTLNAPDETQALLERLVERKRLIAPVMVSHVLATLQSTGRRAALAKVAAALVKLMPPSMPDVPLDLIWGEADTINPPPVEMPPATTLLRLPNTGHMPQVEAASKVNAVIRAALAA